MQRIDYDEWSKQHREYIESDQWHELRRTMPGPRQCVVYQETGDLNLHHMHYPNNLYQTLHCHCVWLCRSCHEAFHRRVKGTLPHQNETWEQMRLHTIKIVQRELNSTKKPIKKKTAQVVAKLFVFQDLKPIPQKTYAVSTAPEYLKTIRKQFFNSDGTQKKTSGSKQKRKARRMAERFAKVPGGFIFIPPKHY